MSCSSSLRTSFQRRNYHVRTIFARHQGPGDYLTALSLFKVDAPLTGEEAGKLLEVYAKYLPETDDPEYCKICLAADLLPGREDPADFAALELGDATVAALLEASGIIAGKAEVDGGRAKHIAEMVKGRPRPCQRESCWPGPRWTSWRDPGMWRPCGRSLSWRNF